MFNYFHYRGVCSLDLGVLVSDAEPWTTKVTPETVTIPGRGDALLGYEYSNSDAVYNIIIRKTGRDTLTDAVERVRRWLLPDVDYSPLRHGKKRSNHMTSDEIISEMQNRVVETLNAYEMPTTVKVLVLENAILRYNIALQKQQIEAAAEPPAQVDPADDPSAQAEESEQEADNA